MTFEAVERREPVSSDVVPGFIISDCLGHRVCWAWKDAEFYTAVLFQYGSPSAYLN
jgi:hypothetical protein